MERELTGHAEWVFSVAISPDGTWAASGSGDKTVRIWDIETGECHTALIGHTGQVMCLTITPNGERIISASEDKTIRVWDAKTYEHLLTLEGHQDAIWKIFTLHDGKRLLSSSLDGTLRLWDIISGKCLKVIEGSNDFIFSVAVSPDDKRGISGQRNGKLRLWDIENGKCLLTMKRHQNRVYSVQITSDGKYAVSGSDDKTIKIWNMETGTCVGTLEGHQHWIHSIAISPNGSWIASTGCRDQTVRLWDLKSGVCLQVIKYDGHPSPISVTFSPDGLRLLVGTAKATIYIYRLTGVRTTSPTASARRYTNAKVVLVGESGVGKSGLAHRLIEDRFVLTESTHGMQVWQLDLPLERDDTLEREALLWDWAGQPDYRLTHQLFLDETALALLLFNPQKEDPFTEVGEWLKVLRAAVIQDGAREVAKLLIAARVDRGGLKVSAAKMSDIAGSTGWRLTCPPARNAATTARMSRI